MTEEEIKSIEDTIEDVRENYNEDKELCCDIELIDILEKLYSEYKKQQKEIQKYKNIAESEKTIHTDLKRQRDDLTKDKIKLVAEKRELEKEIEELKTKINPKIIENSNSEFEVIEKGTYIPKSKIEEKIEELEDGIKLYKEWTKQGIETDIEYYSNIGNEVAVKILQELLESE